jgi:hypothetical protein
MARAEVKVEGNPAEVRVTTSRDSISDVLSCSAPRSTCIPDRYSPRRTGARNLFGLFGQVISRLLDGYDYVIKTIGRDRGRCLRQERRDRDAAQSHLSQSRSGQRRVVSLALTAKY